VSADPMALLAQTQFTLSANLPGILALIAGILILIMPRLLNYIVAVYLIVIGLIAVFNIQV
jgi:hypothetical protein